MCHLCGDNFATQFCLPLLLEKLLSDVNSAKLDSLQTLVSRLLVVAFVCKLWKFCMTLPTVFVDTLMLSEFVCIDGFTVTEPCCPYWSKLLDCMINFINALIG